MSTERGNIKRKGQAHQNAFTFRHNKNSKLTQKILDMPIQSVCERCKEKLEWKKKYRKYKPLTTPGKCKRCGQRNVKAAYHEICKDCSEKDHICAMCLNPLPERSQEEEEEEEMMNEGMPTGKENKKKNNKEEDLSDSDMDFSDYDDDEYNLDDLY
ncbi:hypothetical protein WA158_004868 [Blastocystis sp. Blastoise]